MESDDDIQSVFDRIAKKFEHADGSAKEMFAMLVATALRYRDQVVAEGGEALTVGETREALDAFMAVIKTHEIPEGLPPRVKALVMLWLEEIRRKIHN